MREPKRWSDGGEPPDPEIARLLRAAPPSRPMTPQQYARTWRSVRRLVALPAAAGLMLWVKGGIAALAIGATTTATYYAVEHVRARQERSVETASASDRPNPSSPLVVAAPAASDAGFDAPEAGDAQDDAALEVSVAKPAPTTSTPVQEPKDSLDEEIAMLEDARSLLSSNPARAYEVLQRHAARFPRGKLGMERQLMMIEALQKQGRTTEARSLCESLLARSKGSLYEARLQRMLDNM